MTQEEKQTAIPRLRFSEFRNAPAWISKELRSIADPISERAKENDANHILTLSAEHGLVLQSEYFGKQVAGTNAERYFKIRRNDFVYNDRTTKASEYGTIKRLTKYPHGIVSPIYKCFRFRNEESSSFWEFYFESAAHEWQLRKLANEGARAGRFNVTIERFLSTRVFSPETSSGEQKKVAECLSTLDELIEAESRKLDALKDHKKGLMQQLFPREGETRPRLRFAEFRASSDWERGVVRNIATVLQGYGFPEKYQGNTSAEFPFYKVSDISRTLAAGRHLMDEAANYIDHETLEKLKAKPIPAGTTIFAKIGEALRLNRRALTTRPCLIDNNTAGVKAIEEKATDLFLYYLFSTISLEKHAGGVVPAVSKTAIEEIEILYPKRDEQARIATFLSSIDDLIAAQSEKLEVLRTHKRGLMQQLFPIPSEFES